jgi:hypothetical protein
MRTLQEALGQFHFHPATDDTRPKHAFVREAFASTVELLWGAVPDGPEKTVMLRKLQEAQMYANLAIALTAPAVTPDDDMTAFYDARNAGTGQFADEGP